MAGAESTTWKVMARSGAVFRSCSKYPCSRAHFGSHCSDYFSLFSFRDVHAGSLRTSKTARTIIRSSRSS
jgi:hypothetical protein